MISTEIPVKNVAIIALFTYCNSRRKVVRYSNINTFVLILRTSAIRKKRRRDNVKSL